MANISQHEAAELWEITRDHIGTAARLNWFTQGVRDPQLRQTLQRHAQHFHQAAQTLAGMLQNHPGQQPPMPYQHNQHNQHNQQNPQSLPNQQGRSPQPNQQGNSMVQPLDAILVLDCLADCKSMAVNCIRGATEASQPARAYLYQLSGEHLRAAEEHFQWLDQRGLYAAPSADDQIIHQYAQTLNHIANAGMQMVQDMNQYQTQIPGAPQPAYSSGYGPTGQSSTYQPAGVPGYAGAGAGAAKPFAKQVHGDPLDAGR